MTRLCFSPAGRAEAHPDLDGLREKALVVTGFGARSENRPLIELKVPILKERMIKK